MDLEENYKRFWQDYTALIDLNNFSRRNSMKTTRLRQEVTVGHKLSVLKRSLLKY